MNLVSIIMPCYNMGKYVGQALDSIASQTHPHWELIVVDDCGALDGTKEQLDVFGAAHPDHRIAYTRHMTNRGVSAARNTALASAQGDLLAFLDPDDLWTPNHLSAQVKAITVRGADVAYTGVNMIDSNGIAMGTFYPSERFIKGLPEALYCKNEIHLSTVVVRRAVVADVGGFDETPDIQHVEDWDLWMRLALAGAKFAYISVPGTFYRRHPASASADLSKMWQRSLNLMKKHQREFRVMAALFTKSFRIEEELDQLQNRYNGLRTIYGRTVDRRLKNSLQKMFGLKPSSDNFL